MKHGFVLASLLSVAATMLPAAVNAADANYFKGKTIKIIIPYGPGGTYDLYGQSFATFLGNHVPGKPNVIVQHMPGAGGVKAMNWAYTVMPNHWHLVVRPGTESEAQA